MHHSSSYLGRKIILTGEKAITDIIFGEHVRKGACNHLLFSQCLLQLLTVGINGDVARLLFHLHSLFLCKKKFESTLKVAARLDDFDYIDLFIEVVLGHLHRFLSP